MAIATATTAFALFVALYALTGHHTRRYGAARTKDRRRKCAGTVCKLLLVRAVWFAVLFVAASISIVAAVPKMAWIEVAIIYGAIIAIVVALMQAAEWRELAKTAEDQGPTYTTADGRQLEVPPDIAALIEETTVHMRGDSKKGE